MIEKAGVGTLHMAGKTRLCTATAAAAVQTSWTAVVQAAEGARGRELLDVATACTSEASRRPAWRNTRMKSAAPQALLV